VVVNRIDGWYIRLYLLYKCMVGEEGEEDRRESGISMGVLFASPWGQ